MLNPKPEHECCSRIAHVSSAAALRKAEGLRHIVLLVRRAVVQKFGRVKRMFLAVQCFCCIALPILRQTSGARRVPLLAALAMAQPGNAKRSAPPPGSEEGPCKTQKSLLCAAFQQGAEPAASKHSVEAKDSVSPGVVRADVDVAPVEASLTETQEDEVWEGLSEWCESQPGFASSDLDHCSQSQNEPASAGSEAAASQPGFCGPHVLENDRLEGSDGPDKSECSDTDSQVTLEPALEAGLAHPIPANLIDSVQDDLLETLGWAQDQSIPRFRGVSGNGRLAHLRLYDLQWVVDQSSFTKWKGSVRAWVSSRIFENGNGAAFETDSRVRSEQFLGWAAAFWFEDVRGRWTTWSLARRRVALMRVRHWAATKGESKIPFLFNSGMANSRALDALPLPPAPLPGPVPVA